MQKIIPIIMAGGSGTRLWPLSRTQYPKQFLTLGLGEHTLLQATALRLAGTAYDDPIVICNEEHRFLVAEQLRAINITPTIILEPIGKNTAPAIALATLYLKKLGKENVPVLVLPADHLIKDQDALNASIQNAMDLVQQNKLVTFGIVPTHAETGYGYIKVGEPILQGYHISEFVEKPNQVTAQRYIDSQQYLWNGGIFAFSSQQYLNELTKFAPDIIQSCQSAIDKSQTDLDFIRIDKASFENCPSDSIDYAVMEKTTNGAIVPLNAGWNDIGSWSSLWDIQHKDDDGNVIFGDVIIHQSTNNYCHSENRLVALLGVENLIVVETKDAILIANKDNAQDIKKIAETLKQNNRQEYHSHREMYRPWGKYDSIDYADRYQVKRITVNPKQKLSVQMHHHRSEHWVVVKGTAKIYKGNESFLLTENESVYIPLGEIHALENPGILPLELIEVQSGSYLGEDDIVRFTDMYGRN